MARIFDVVEYPNEMRDELVHRFPEQGSGDFRIGSVVIVREGQAAVFFRDGKALDAFGPGRHQITTANIPLVTGLLGKLFNDRTPFTAEVYFVSTREFPQQKWGTSQPVPIMHPGVGLGASLLRAYGTFGMQISNPQQFVSQFVGAQGAYEFADIRQRLVGLIIQGLRDLLGELKKSAFEVQGLTQDIAAGVRAKTVDDFNALGLALKAVIVEAISPSETTAEDLRKMGLIDTQTYAQLQAADAMREAATAPGGNLAGAGVGLGAGLGLGQMMTGMMGNLQPGAQHPQGGQPAAPTAPTTPAAPAGGAAPDVMSPAQAATYLQVTEADVMQMIQGGQIKAKQIGAQYRISKSALDDFLKS
jgi:excisionase family DNA binding protein